MLFLWLMAGGFCLAASGTQSVETNFPDIEQNIQPFKEMADKHRDLKRQEKQLEEQIEQARKAPSPEIVQFRKEIDQLHIDRDNAASALTAAKGRGWIVTMIGRFSWPVGGIVFLFSLVAFYLYRNKKDLTFRIAYSDMLSSLFHTLKPSGTTQKSRFGFLLLVMAVTSLILVLLAVLTNSLWASEESQPSQGVVHWEAQKQNFDQNVEDFKVLKNLTGYSRLAFMLEHPITQVIDLGDATSLWEKNGLTFRQAPSLRFTSKSLRANSFEYLFLLGRCYYEEAKPDYAFRYFALASDLKGHAFENRYVAERYLLNLIEIAILSNKGSQFDELERQLLENARSEIQLEFADFLVFKADRKKGLDLFQRTLVRDIKPAMELLAKVLQKLGPEEAYGFCRAALDELIKTKNSPEMLVQLLNNNWSAITSGNSPTLKNNYITLLKDATSQVQDIPIRLKSLQLLLQEDQKDFVRSGLEQIKQLGVGKLTISDYLAVATLYQNLGDNPNANHVLEYAITKVFPRDVQALKALLSYCLEKEDFEWANRSLEIILNNFPEIGSSATNWDLISSLKINLPLPWEPLPLRGFYGLLQDRINNHGEARSKLEAALKPNLEEALQKYSKDIDLNINVLYFLLKKYQDLKDIQKFQAVYPLYQDSTANYWSKNKISWQQKMDELSNRVTGLEKERQAQIPTPEEMRNQKQFLQNEILSLNRNATLAKLKSTINTLATVLISVLFAVCLLGALFYVICRASHHARQATHWKMASFMIRFQEGCGFALMMTVVFLPIGGGMVLFSQFILALLKKNETLPSEV